MTTQHRGLPPPAAMTLPDPTRSTQALPHETRNSHHHYTTREQYSAPEDVSYATAQTLRSEEEKRRQEEEKTKQEDLRLRQREIEMLMLRDALGGGVPPQLVPIIFAGISGGPLAAAGLEYAQQSFAQFLQSASAQMQTQPGRPMSPSRQDSKGNAYLPSQSTGHMLPSQSQPAGAYPSPAYASPRSSARQIYAAAGQQYPGPTSAPRAPAQTLSSLPRLTTNEAAPIPTAPAYGPAPPHAQNQHTDGQPSPSPSIYFHHWQPPEATGNKSSKDSHKTSPKSVQQSTSSQEQSSPRKRKTNSSTESAGLHAKQSPAFSTVSTASSKSRRPTTSGGRRGSGDSTTMRAYDPIGRDSKRPRRERSSSQDEGESASKHSSSRQATPAQRAEDTPKQE